MEGKFNLYYLLITVLTFSLLITCKKESVYNVPAVVISPITSVTAEGARSGGDIISEGSGSVTLKGICWSTSPNPTVADSKTSNGAGRGSFTSDITRLLPGKNYYIRAYAVNDYGTGYSSQTSFTTLASVPIVITQNLTGLSPASVYVTGIISKDGGTAVTARGFCWSTVQYPTTSDNITKDGTGDGNFSDAINGLSADQIYYVRAYATNSEGTAYGNQIPVITVSGSPVITDGDYKVLQKSSTGRGIDIVFMGDGYTPENILAGNYENNIRQAYTSFFDIEPYKTYSAYFNVYMVFAVSEQSGISDLARNINTRFQTKFTGSGTSTAMSLNKATCSVYALKPPVKDIDNTLAVVIANSTRYGGTTYTHAGQKGINISICPVPPGFFSNILQHEAAGHGFGNLADEYVNFSGTLPQSLVNFLVTEHTYGVYTNVDITNDHSKVLWNHFFGLANYSYVNTYEGGNLYALGVWRPEQASLMSNNIPYINAPSREAIVKRIMQLAGFTYSFADFQAKDVAQPPLRAALLPLEKSLQLAPPVIIY